MQTADRLEHAAREITRLSSSLHGRVGVVARDIESGRQIEVRAGEQFPLASVYKVPVMVAVLRTVDAGDLALDEHIELQEGDKSPGGIFMFLEAGLRLSVRDLLYFMITQSDNTATDLLWRRIGANTTNAAMRSLGLAGIDCYMPDREFFLLECGLGMDLVPDDPEKLVTAILTARQEGCLEELFTELRRRHEDLDGGALQAAYDEMWGLAGERNRERALIIDQALDNVGSPADIARLMTLIARGGCAAPASCQLMMEILGRQESRDRIPAGLPAGLFIANKTGSVGGTVNDVAVVRTPGGRELVIVVLTAGLDETGEKQAPGVIAAIAGVAYAALQGEDEGS